ncbi:MAG: hypothetical protein AB4352_00675 [Hormoscilla sp.]
MEFEKPGFWENLGGKAKISAETRFLVLSRSGGDRGGSLVPGFWENLGGKAKITAETRFLVLSRPERQLARRSTVQVR